MIIVDESDPIDELEPAFPYRDVNIRRGTSIRDAYEILDEIGRGKFGRVYRCRDKTTGLTLAAKVVTTKKKEEKRNVEREIEIMKTLQHPRLIQLFDAIEDVNRAETCLVLEMVGGGELFDRVIQDEFILTERACAVFVRQICEAIEYIHSKGILHLDMKPENVMCLSKHGNRIKIIDFGLARFYDPAKKLQVLFGTPEFVAPEVVNFDEITFATDLWSVGVITYVLLSGLSPFMGETDVETMANVTIAKYDFDDEAFDDISEDAQDFISKLLTKDKKKRLLATDCLKHQWLLPAMPTTKNISTEKISSSSSSTSTPSSHPSLLLPFTSPKCSTTTRTTSSSSKNDGIDVELSIDITPPTPDDNERGKLFCCSHGSMSDLSTSSCSSFNPSSSCSNSCSSSSSSSPVQQQLQKQQQQPHHHHHHHHQHQHQHHHPIIMSSEKRASLDLTKDHLRTFVSRWTDKPYIFDSPRGIISHIYNNNDESSSTSSSSSLLPSSSNELNNMMTRRAMNDSTTVVGHTNSLDCGVNIVGQIRRFSYQLHEDLQIIKTHSQCVGVDNLRKCSWNEVPVNVQ